MMGLCYILAVPNEVGQETAGVIAPGLCRNDAVEYSAVIQHYYLEPEYVRINIRLWSM
jgi:hypothetical protein